MAGVEAAAGKLLTNQANVIGCEPAGTLVLSFNR